MYLSDPLDDLFFEDVDPATQLDLDLFDPIYLLECLEMALRIVSLGLGGIRLQSLLVLEYQVLGGEGLGRDDIVL